MNEFDVYKTYIAIKLHFTTDYDYHKYNGKCNATVSSFRKRKDQFFFKKLGRIYNKQQLEHFFVSNFLADEKVWVREMLSADCENVYKDWQKKTESLMYFFKQDCNFLSAYIDDNEKFDTLFVVKEGQHPPLLRFALAKKINLESFIVINSVLRFVNTWNKQIVDTIVWPTYYNKCKKYRSFLDFNSTKAKLILKKCLDI